MMAVPTSSNDANMGGVPVRALLLSLLALAVPVGLAVFLPELASEEVGLLVWLCALVPPFLLTYHRSWRGASLALAAGMAALSLSQVVLAAAEVEAPDFSTLLWVVSVIIAVSLGSGWLSERLHRARRDAESMALTDGLTGLANRRHVTVFLESAFAAAERDVPLAVALFDLDHFKEVNDRQGHQEGDEVLQRFARMLENGTRDMNLSGRWGGEEFLSVLSGTDLEGAHTFAERIRQMVQEIEFPWGKVTVSAGVAAYVPEMRTPEVLVAAADQALYRAKEEGRNRVAVARSPDAAEATGRTTQTTHRRLRPEKDEPAPVPRAEPKDDGTPRGNGEVLLVVDDDRDARRSVSRALARYGYRALQAGGPDEALEIVHGREEPVDLLVTDVIMPSMSGFRLVEILQREIPDLRVVYMSGYAQEGVDWQGTPGTAATFLSKPMSVTDLAHAVREVLDRTDVPVEDEETTETAAAETDAAESPTAVESRSRPPSRVRRREAAKVDSEDLGQARLLVIDDDPDVARSLGLLLRRCGFGEVRGTTDPGDLPKLLAHYSPDLVLLDLHMPGIDGLQVLQALRDFEPDLFLPVVVVTGDEQPEVRRKALEAGASDFLNKPVEVWELEPRIRNLLRIRMMLKKRAEEAQTLESRVAARTAELEEARTEVLLRLARAAEYRDDVTGRHAERVGTLAGLIAEHLGVDSKERDLLQRAAPLHDVGKIGVPDGILRKPGALDEPEMEVMRAHTTIGAQILGGSRVPLLRAAREIALHHHERWNGSGYPTGLEAEEIPLSARIVAVADVYDSLTHDRPYRKALTPEEALKHLNENSGKLYDPEIVSALLELHCTRRMANAEAVEIIAHPEGARRPPGTSESPADRDGKESQ